MGSMGTSEPFFMANLRSLREFGSVGIFDISIVQIDRIKYEPYCLTQHRHRALIGVLVLSTASDPI